MYVLLITRLLRLVGRWARKPVNHTSWVAVVTPTDRPKSVRNRCVIELFCGVVYVVTLPFWHFCWCMGFCHRTESDLFLFLLVNLVKYSNNCKNSGLYMVKAYGLVAITSIINGPFYNESTKTNNGHVRCQYVGKESRPNYQCQIK